MTISNRVRTIQAELGVPVDGIMGTITLDAIVAAVAELKALKARTAPAGPPAPPNTVSGAVAHPGAPQGHKLASPDKFYTLLRRDVFGGKLATSQFEGTETLLAAMADWPLSWVAYGLATSKHETDATMQPIHEKGGHAYLKRMYDIEGARPAKARELGNLSPGDGAKYAGRGYVQLTGKTNYAKAAAKVGFDLLGVPDLAMKPHIAAKILNWGMSAGAFTGKRLGDYLAGGHGSLDQFREARRIINGTDRAVEIARLAEKFQAALVAGGWA